MKIIRLGERYFDLHAPAECARVSPEALRGFFELMQAWDVGDADARTLMGRLTSEEFARLRADPQGQILDPTKLKRIAGLLSIGRELRLLYGPSVADEWVRLPNSHAMFCSVKPITYMLIGGVQAMTNVQRLLVRRRRATYESAAEKSECISSTPPLPPPD